MKKIIWKIVAGIGVLMFLVIMMLWLSGTFRHKIKPGAIVAKPQPAASKTVAVKRKVFPLITEQVGTIRSKTEATVSSRIMAQIVEISVSEGDKVLLGENGEASTVLIRLDDRDIQARLRQSISQVQMIESGIRAAESQVRSAQAHLRAAQARARQVLSDYTRYSDLYANQAATGQQLDEARAQKEIAQAQEEASGISLETARLEIVRLEAQKQQSQQALEEARVMLSYTMITAPISGQVTQKMVDVGDMVAPGVPLMLVESSSQPELNAVISESLIQHLHVGMAVPVKLEALGLSFDGVLRQIIPRADPVTRTVMVKVALTGHPGLLSGLFGRLMIPVGDYEALVIPQAVLEKVGQLDLVQVVDAQGYPRRRFVTLGKTHEADVEVLSGLQEGEAVVIR
ncbi:MAG: efflux RND transporter periplasmic adaptor subunit [Phycisphaerae bacterium]|nr:efflux RND transporter periplasmic adaptor subunit [Phycisphaerae bacterium]